MKTGRPAKRAAIFRPVASGWQKWLQDEAGAWQPAGEGPDLDSLKPGEGGLVAVPVRRAFSFAVWVPGADPALFSDLVFTQLELRGLASRTRDSTVFAWTKIDESGEDALLRVVVLPSHLAPQYWSGEVADYSVSPDCLPLEPDAVTLWEEEGGWVAAVTHGDKLLHFQTMGGTSPDSSMALEVWMMLAPLEAGRMLRGIHRAVVYTPAGAAIDLREWTEAGGLPVESKPLPPPVKPPPELACVPLPVREVRTAKQAGARRQRIALIAAAAYFLVVIALAANTLWLHFKARGLQAAIDRDAAAVAAVRQTMQRWEAMQPALNPLGYPLEVLFQTARLLPEDGVRLTLFQTSLDRVVVAGEASTLQAAQRFQEDVRTNPELALYDWTVENPKPLATGSARFQIDGVRAGAAPNGESGDAGSDG